MAKGRDTAFGRIARSDRRLRGKRVAYKFVDISLALKQKRSDGKSCPENAFMEVRILDYFRRHPHPNVLGLIRTEGDTNEMRITMPCAVGDLLDFLKAVHGKGIALGVDKQKMVIADILSGVRHLHERGIVHRDISPENILLFNGGPGERDHCVVSGFGLASQMRVENCADFRPATDIMSALRRVGPLPVPEAPADGPHPARFRRLVGKWGYMAPEIWRGEEHCAMKADAFAVGVVLYMIFTGRKPFERAEPSDPCYEYFHKGRALDLLRGHGVLEKFPGDSLSLVLDLLRHDPAERSSIAKACNHSFMKGVPRARSEVLGGEGVKRGIPEGRSDA